MVLQGGEEWPPDGLARRLDGAYYSLTRTTARHFGRGGDGWFLTGVAGLDAPTMNRAVVEDAPATEVNRLVSEANAYFAERECQWSVVLSSYRDTSRWHAELVARGFAVTSTLDILVREPAPLRDAGHDARVRLARPDETALFVEILMEVFRMPRRFYPALLDMTEAWRRHGARLYLGEVDGQAVATALLATMDGVAGIYNVGTLRQARRLGLAKAMMARALEDAKDADLVTLQVAPEGFVEGFYLDLGFEPRYSWRFYSPRARFGLFNTP